MRVVHVNKELYDVYIGRPSKWGNPFRTGHGTRAEVIKKYRDWLLNTDHMVAMVREELRGKVLGCWCAPKACHGDVLLEIANEELESD